MKLLSPGFQSPDGRLYPSGLVRAWRAQLPDDARFPMACKIRQTFDTGWRVALVEAAAYGVARLHIALIPKWAHGTPDWSWIRTTIRELDDLIPATVQTFIRLGNYRDGKNEGCTFNVHAHHEADLGAWLGAHFSRFEWAVGDDRGMVAAVKGWRERKAALRPGQAAPAMAEIQSYLESGLTEDHPGELVDALFRAGFHGSIAFVECHRWFKPQERNWKDYTRLTTAETGEALLRISTACEAHGIGWMLFTGDTAFADLDPAQPLNNAGLALFNRPRIPVTAYKPNWLKAWWTSHRLITA